MDQPGKVANLACGQLNREKKYFPFFVPVPAREFGLARWAYVCSFSTLSQAESGATHGIPHDFRGTVYLFILNRHPPLGQSRVYQVTQLRSWYSTNSVHCREYAGSGPPVVLKVVPVMGAAFSGFIMDQLMFASLFPHPLMVCSVFVCVFFPFILDIKFVWTCQPGSHRRKVTQDFSSTFFLRCVP